MTPEEPTAPPFRTDWARDEVAAIYRRPLLDLVASVARTGFVPKRVQLTALLSAKSGGCPEDCAYCPQSGRWSTHVEPTDLLDPADVRSFAEKARERGVSRVCIGGAYRDLPEGQTFERILEMVRTVRRLDLDVCLTMGMVSKEQARRLKQAGLSVYNHNLDTGELAYHRIITTRSYQDRLDTIRNLQEAGIAVCTGGILGVGETEEDRIDLLHRLATFDPHPESVPINTLVPVPGTPLENAKKVDPLDLVRVIATARLLMPRSRIRLSAGRRDLDRAAQTLCFLAGADSVFVGDKLLTTENVSQDADAALFADLGLIKERCLAPRPKVV